MSLFFRPFEDEQLRALINIQPAYEGWMEAQRARISLAYNLKWKTIKGRAYLYEVSDRVGNGRSLGPLSDETERIFIQYHSAKKEVQARLIQAGSRLHTAAAIYRVLDLPLLSPHEAKVLRDIDLRNQMGTHSIVIGEICMLAYMVEAGGRIMGGNSGVQDRNLFLSPKPPGTYDVMPVEDGPPPSVAIPLPSHERDWLLGGKFVDRVLGARDGTAARIVAPDPRFWALYKLWSSERDDRDPLARSKDLAVGTALLDIVEAAMPHFPLEAEFQATIPHKLTPHFACWIENRDCRGGPPYDEPNLK